MWVLWICTLGLKECILRARCFATFEKEREKERALPLFPLFLSSLCLFAEGRALFFPLTSDLTEEWKNLFPSKIARRSRGARVLRSDRNKTEVREPAVGFFFFFFYLVFSNPLFPLPFFPNQTSRAEEGNNLFPSSAALPFPSSIFLSLLGNKHALNSLYL